MFSIPGQSAGDLHPSDFSHTPAVVSQGMMERWRDGWMERKREGVQMCHPHVDRRPSVLYDTDAPLKLLPRAHTHTHTPTQRHCDLIGRLRY